MGQRVFFVVAVMGLVAASVVAAGSLVNAEDVTTADESAAVGVAAPRAQAVGELESENGIEKPACEYPDTCPPPPKCVISLAFPGGWVVLDDSVADTLGLQVEASHSGCPAGSIFVGILGGDRMPVENPISGGIGYECGRSLPRPGPNIGFEVLAPDGATLASISREIPDPRPFCSAFEDMT